MKSLPYKYKIYESIKVPKINLVKSQKMSDLYQRIQRLDGDKTQGFMVLFQFNNLGNIGSLFLKLVLENLEPKFDRNLDFFLA